MCSLCDVHPFLQQKSPWGPLKGQLGTTSYLALDTSLADEEQDVVRFRLEDSSLQKDRP